MQDGVYVLSCDCKTPFGEAEETYRALLAGKVALKPTPVRGTSGGDLVPLSLMAARPLEEQLPPSWERELTGWRERVGGPEWGTARRPVLVTSSNFGVGSQFAYRWDGNDRRHLVHGAPSQCVERLRAFMGWGENVAAYSHACVSSHLGLAQASRLLNSGMADQVLVFSFDFLSPFVAGGFHALKILNEGFPAPFQKRETGSIGLGDGAAYAILAREGSGFSIGSHALFNEMHHFTANAADGSGFAEVQRSMASILGGRKVWLKGHGTGTNEAGRLETELAALHFPEAPLVGWKGSLGHTLGSCGLVELAIACRAILHGEAPGTVGTTGETFSRHVAVAPFSLRGFEGVVCSSNAFGGAHASFLLCHD